MFFAEADVYNQPVAVVVLLMFVAGAGWFFKTGFDYIKELVPKFLEFLDKQIEKVTSRFETAMDKMGKNFSVCMQDLKDRVDVIDNNVVDIQEDVSEVKDTQKKIVEKIDSFHRVENFSK